MFSSDVKAKGSPHGEPACEITLSHMPSRNISPIGTRIQRRLQALGKSARAASIEAGLSGSAIKNILANPTQSPTGRVLEALARVLRTTEAWLLREEGPEDVEPAYDPKAEGYRPPPVFFNERDRMPVYASAEGGSGALIVSTDEIDRLPRPYKLENIPEAYGILVEGESMVPAYEPGDVAWVNPRLGPRRDRDVILYSEIDGSSDRKATIKRLKNWTDDLWTVQQWNPAKTFKLPRAEWTVCHRVVGKFSRE